MLNIWPRHLFSASTNLLPEWFVHPLVETMTLASQRVRQRFVRIRRFLIALSERVLRFTGRFGVTVAGQCEQDVDTIQTYK